MRSTFALAVLTGALSVSAFSLSARQNIPGKGYFYLLQIVRFLTYTLLITACVATCLTTADYGSCSSTDYACLCKSQAYIDSSTKCILAGCNAADAATGESLAQTICSSVVRPILF